MKTYRVSVMLGCGYAEISRRKSLTRALSDAARAIAEYGIECDPLINGRAWHLVAASDEIAPGLYARRG